jgi:hypothetical protein
MSNILLFYLLATFLSTPENPESPNVKNEHVQFQARVAKPVFVAGKRAEVLFILTPRSGIHVNTDPSVEMTIADNQWFLLDGFTAPTHPKKKEYVDTRRPIRCTISVSAKTPPGKHILKGTMTYFYCSDREGWCNRFAQPFEVTLVIKK